MPNIELAGWVAVIAAATVLVAFVAGSAGRYALRARNLRRLLAASRGEQIPMPHRGDVSRGRGAEVLRSTAVPSSPHRQPAPAAPPGSVADGRK